ncbi:FGGY family carbohydrate kinase, partial [Burkholderia pseudomallei]
ARHAPAVSGRHACVLMPKEYLRLKLTGEKVSDPSDAAGTRWLDAARRDWSGALLAAGGMTRAQRPRIVEGNAPSGTLRADVAR